MARIFLTSIHHATFFILLVSVLAACTRNPDGAERRRSEPRPAPEIAETQPAPPPVQGQDQLPEGHPPLDQFQDPAEGAPVPAAPEGEVAAITVAGIRWEAPAPLQYRRPSSQMRAAEYLVEGGDPNTVLTVFHFPGGGGGIQANVDRWVGQMQTSEERPPEISQATVNGLSVTKLDVHGGFGGMQAPGQQAAEAAGGFRMLGAIVEGAQGPVFFKLVGPESTVDLAADAFEGLIASFTPAS